MFFLLCSLFLEVVGVMLYRVTLVPPCATETPRMDEPQCASGVVTGEPACVLPGTPCVKGAPQLGGTTCAREAARVCGLPCVDGAPQAEETAVSHPRTVLRTRVPCYSHPRSLPPAVPLSHTACREARTPAHP